MFSRSKNKAGKDKPKLDDNAKKERMKPFLIDVAGMPGIPQLGQDEDDDEYDSDLEAELLALTQGSAAPAKGGRKATNASNLNQMVDECMRDDFNDTLSDEDDPELLAELSALATEEPDEVMMAPAEQTSRKPSVPDVQRPAPVIVRPSPMAAGPSLLALLKDRKLMYEEAERNAVESGENSRAKRFKRGLGTINQMIKAVEAGRGVKEEDIPPAVLVGSSRASSNIDLAESNVKPTSSSVPSNMISAEVMLPSGPQDSISNNQNSFANGGSLRPDVLPHATNVASSQLPLLSPTQPSAGLVQPDPTYHARAQLVDRSQELGATKENSALAAVTKRQLEYKTTALDAKKRGDIEEAMRLLKVAKQLQPLVDAAREGKDVDVDTLPPHPSNSVTSQPAPPEVISQPSMAPPSSDKPITTMEALQQRMAKYEEQRDKAKADENARKQRMLQRIVKQYQAAITQVQLGRLIDFTELPTPPGFPPIPVAGVTPASRPSLVPQPPSTTAEAVVPPAQPAQPEEPKPKQLKPNPVSAGSSSAVQVTPNVRNAPKSRVERQLSLLQKRQQQFREAALESKKNGEIEQAKEYLRNSKGFNQLIQASQGGLPVDMNTAPIPPQEVMASFTVVSDFEMIAKEDCEILPPKTAADMAVTYTKLEDDLISQIKMCARTREHFKAVGDVASANRFEQLILHSKKDLDSVRAAFKRGDTPPKFHYETRSFTMIQCNTDLNDSDLEVVVVRGINYNVPNPQEVDTYVRVEFPYPTEAPPQDKTEAVKNTNCPEYNHKFLFSIDRKSRSVARIFKRQTVKCHVVNKGSWYHRDNVMGTVKVPLSHLENKCTHHDSYDLMDDKKKMVGGKLEVKLRARNPILTKQLEKMSEKWLVIDGF